MRQRLAVILVDGSNAFATARELGFHIDYKALLEAYEKEVCPVLKAFHFTALMPPSPDDPVRKMVDYLSYNDWTTITKPVSEWTDANGNKRIKGNMDIEIATIAFEMATAGQGVTDIVLFSGDGDFTFMVESLQRRYGLRVTVVSSIETSPSMCADNLRRQCDEFLEMKELIKDIQRVRRAR